MATVRAAKAASQPPSAGLRQQLELYRKIFANSVDGIAIIDCQGFYVEQNQAHSELTGYSDQELVDVTPAVHLGEEVFSQIAAVLRRGESFRGEVVSRTRSGVHKRLDLSAFPVCNENGEILCFVGIKKDITERERAEKERDARLRELESVYALAQALNRAIAPDEVYSAALDALTSVTGTDRASILLLDDSGSMRFMAWRGLSPEYRGAVEGHSPWEAGAVNLQPIVVEDVAADSSLGNLRDAIQREAIGSLAFIPICYEGKLLGKFMIYFSEPHSFRTSELRLAEVIATHIGAAIYRRRADDTLRQSEKLAAAGRLAATVAHEINNPLEAVTNLLYLAKGAKSDETMRSYIEDAERELARVSQIARQTLAFYRDNGAQSKVNITEVLQSAVAIYGNKVQERATKIECIWDSSRLEVLGFAGELRQLFSNLIVNAIDATPPGKTIRITAAHTGNDIQIEIADQGPGISAQHLNNIFQPFFTTKSRIGTGLGLWVAREVARKHGGTVELFSSTDLESHGTRAVVRLPSSTTCHA